MFPAAIKLENTIGNITNMDVEVFMRTDKLFTFIIAGDVRAELKQFEKELGSALGKVELLFDENTNETYGYFSI